MYNSTLMDSNVVFVFLFLNSYLPFQGQNYKRRFFRLLAEKLKYDQYWIKHLQRNRLLFPFVPIKYFSYDIDRVVLKRTSPGNIERLKLIGTIYGWPRQIRLDSHTSSDAELLLLLSGWCIKSTQYNLYRTCSCIQQKAILTASKSMKAEWNDKQQKRQRWWNSKTVSGSINNWHRFAAEFVDYGDSRDGFKYRLSSSFINQHFID